MAFTDILRFSADMEVKTFNDPDYGLASYAAYKENQLQQFRVATTGVIIRGISFIQEGASFASLTVMRWTSECTVCYDEPPLTYTTPGTTM